MAGISRCLSGVRTPSGSGWRVIAAFTRQLPGTGGAVIALASDHTIGNLPYASPKAHLTVSCSRRRMSFPTSTCEQM
jgi:hypothetical protein